MGARLRTVGRIAERELKAEFATQNTGEVEPFDPGTFVEFCVFLGVKLSDAQRVLCMIAFDGLEPKDLEARDRAIAAQLLGPIDVIPKVARQVLVCVMGGRAGKSYVFGALYSLWRCLAADLSTLAPGELAVGIIIARDLDLARQTLTYVTGAARSSPRLAAMIISDGTNRLEIKRPDGHSVAVIVKAASGGGAGGRGRTLVSAVLDECAFFRDNSYKINDEDVFKAVHPRVLPGGMTLLISTPWAEIGLLYDEFERNHGHPKTAIAAHAPTLVMFPSERNKLAVAAEYERDPENAEREFGASFMPQGSGLFFDPSSLRKMLRAIKPIRKATRKDQAVVGGDVGLIHDSSAFTAIHRHWFNARLFFPVVDIEEYKPTRGAPLKLSAVVKSGAAMAKRHLTNTVVTDRYNIQAAREHLPKGVSLWAPKETQEAIAERFALARDLINEGRVVGPASFPLFKKLVLQLSQVTKRPMPGGKVKIELMRKPGSHGDIVSAFINGLFVAHHNAPAKPPAPDGKPKEKRTAKRRASADFL